MNNYHEPLLCFLEVIPYETPYAYAYVFEGYLCFELYYIEKQELEWYAVCAEIILDKMMEDL